MKKEILRWSRYNELVQRQKKKFPAFFFDKESERCIFRKINCQFLFTRKHSLISSCKIQNISELIYRLLYIQILVYVDTGYFYNFNISKCCNEDEGIQVKSFCIF